MSVVVVGAGLAGVVAAARLRQAGVAVTVLGDRPGASALHGGGWQIGRAAMARAGLPVERLDDAIAFTADGLAPLALRAGPFVLTDDEGARRAVELAPASHAAAAELPAPFAVVELCGLGHRFAAQQPAGEALALDWPSDRAAFGRSYAAAAVGFDLDRLGDALAAALPDGRFRGVLLPAVLGLDRVEERRHALIERLGVTVAETLCTTPSTAGLRLDRALTAWLDRLGVQVERVRAARVDPDAGRVGLADGRILSADAVILATGGRLTGGLGSVGGARIVEPLLGLPIEPRLPVDPLQAVEPRAVAGAFFRAGVRVDAALRPVRRDGRPAAPRLFVAGDLCGGLDPLVDRCGSGRAVLTGYVAAESALAAMGGKP